ncbi:bifunctional (p)ppGpp synthetase/guanosine-3',5'-bis(diphosphate) 3'-pyrophosphohydrolase [Candidatus Nomurabacteria bacterium]|nr:bifunctional (p)ppGpp synthetase/guanosine-3',5'-bis(diphosphate) 3'-pyrophosphohydrolase [Candidatus Nomurabacteria bacterium]USN95053.1 MAG: bifunctional (p)ppGpp synthetase/guanosine-3',5'-bis(diphosphate) 3'-pyrophosphohydrolase [Candidatus Nomurabacteria bacterium]
MKENFNPQVGDIYNLMKEKPKGEEKTLIKKAFDFAESAHEGQFRSSGDPYFVHVFETAKNLARYEMDATTIAAGLLHDVMEDTEISAKEIEKEFGKEILGLLEGVTKLGKIKYRGEERHVESLRKFFVAVAKDFRVLVIKLADRLHNLKTLEYVKPEKQQRIALESLEVYAPLANRFGIGKLKGEIEDAAFPFAYPEEYKKTVKIFEEKSATSEKRLKKIDRDIKKLLSENDIKYLKIDYRVKHKYSLWKKIKRYKGDVERIYDIMALRVIVDSIEDCYRVLGLVHSKWTPLPGRIKDYIALPKPNGYQSLHTTIFTGDGEIAEIQIRTLEMHGRAEYGIASHFAYKERQNLKKKSRENKFNWVKEVAEKDEETKSHKDFLSTIKMDAFNDRIFVFTPKGSVIDLPEGSCSIDFAYAVHSDIGDKTSSAKVNGKMISIYEPLKSGDIVEIITNKKSHPTSKWLDHAKTTMAKKHINAYLKDNSLLQKFLSFGRK